jgi:hypothetical protein
MEFLMKQSWQELTRMTQGEGIIIERVKVDRTGVAIEGAFELPPLAKLKLEDQVFVMAFVKSHGSIKEMEKMFGVSYPTIKNRLNRIGESFELLQMNVDSSLPAAHAVMTQTEVLEKLERGEITPAEALGMIKR